MLTVVLLIFPVFAMKEMLNIGSMLMKTKRYYFSIHVHKFAKLSLVLGNQWVPL